VSSPRLRLAAMAMVRTPNQAHCWLSGIVADCLMLWLGSAGEDWSGNPDVLGTERLLI
jgi:hypothetical protein